MTADAATAAQTAPSATDEPAPERPAELQAPGYEIFIGLLAVVSLINLAIFILPFDEDTKAIAQLIDIPITFIFLVDFTSRLVRSHPRRVYFIEQKGWLDLLGSLPAYFKIFRIFRLVRVVRLMSEYGFKNIIRSFIKDRASNALLVVVFLVLIVLEFGSMFVVFFEADAPGANITTGGDAVWWAFVSITTVGYGDKFPITTGGRTVAVLILAAGVGLFGVLSGFLANFFLSPAVADADDDGSSAASDPAAASAPVATASTATSTAIAGPETSATAASDDRAELMRMIDRLEGDMAALRTKVEGEPPA